MYRIGIVAHAVRAKAAEALAETVKADFISVDTNGLMGCDANHETVQRHLVELGDTYSVILEDDAVPIQGFREQLEQALVLAPTPVISLYLGKQRPPWAMAGVQAAIADAEAAQADWIVGTHLLHAVGYAMKTEVLRSLLCFPPSQLPVDQHASWFCRSYGYGISYAFPSLVDHADMPTIVDHPDGQPRPPGRVAWKTGKHDAWSTTSVTLRI